MTTLPRFLLEHKNSLHVFEVLDETGSSGKFRGILHDYTFCSVYMSLSTLVFRNQN